MLDINNSFFARKSPPPTSLGASRVQNLSVTSLQQKKDIENAKVSVNSVLRDEPTTSVTHMGKQAAGATTSISRLNKAKFSVADEDYYDEQAEEKRWNYIRQLVAAHKDKEVKQTKTKASSRVSPYDVGIKTGGGFRTSTRLGIRRKFNLLKRQAPSTYKNLSKNDIQYFEDLVKPHAKAVYRGTNFNRLARKKMKSQVEQDRRKGVISFEDAKDMKKLVDNLPH